MKIAFVYDRLNKIGGAERVLEVIHQIWPQAPFYTAVYHPATAPYAEGWKIKTSFLQHLPLAKRHHELYPHLTPFAFEAFDFSNFDLVISITSAEAKGIITKPQTLHLCYCLTPTRYLWSHTSDYQSQTWLFRPLRNFLLTQLRVWDQIAATRPDYYLTISQTSQRRIKKYYHRDSKIIYPPVDTNFFKPQTARRQNMTTGYFLVVSRLVSYKRIDLAIKACNQLNLPLYVVGVGRELRRLRRQAGPTVKFLGQLTDKELLRYYQNCRALIFPGEEDLGLVMLEAQATGKPVIAYRQGGAAEIVIQKKTGLFFDKLSAHELIASLKTFTQCRFNNSRIRRHALKFSLEKFQHQFKAEVVKLWEKHQKKLP
jgi:glycosyltransferase involved in cell wall biosynthesis